MIFMKKMTVFPTIALMVFLFGGLSGAGQRAAEPPRGPVLTVLYDNYPFQDGCSADWGFAALIEGLNQTILFDTGTKGDILIKNIDALKVDLKKVDLIFISHDHGDHTGGLPAVFGRKTGIPVYIPSSANTTLPAEITRVGGRPIPVRDSTEIFPGVLSTGDLGEAIHEQAMIIDSPRGSILITGCAHPGIVSIVEKAKAVGKKDVWMVLGGFHLVNTSPAEVDKIVARFKELGVQRVGATHCTGDAAIGMFRKAFGPGFVELGVGRKIELGGR